MAMEPKAFVLLLLVALALLVGASTHNDQIHQHTSLALDGCQRDCGGLLIPYPFGIGNSSIHKNKTCFLNDSFKLTCNKSDNTTSWGNVPVTAINIIQGKIDMMLYVSEVCYNSSYGSDERNGNDPTLEIYYPDFTISREDNKFISVGCDTYGYLDSYFDGIQYSTGCLSRCYNNTPNKIITDDVSNCSGIGCCQVDIPPAMMNITVQTFSFQNFNSSLEFNNCSYSFIAKNGNYTFSMSHLQKLPNKEMPVVFDWSVGRNETCEESQKTGTNVCRGNSTCVKSRTGHGYLCQCKDGFEGNPYHPKGCTDIDECKTGTHTCDSDHHCKNLNGSHKCSCPHGQSGNGTKEDKCRPQSAFPKFIIGGSAGLITLFTATSALLFMYQKRKLIKIKEKFFKQNGGFLLLQQLSAREQSSQTARIFTADELKKATNNYDENLIVGRGGYGTVFKGILANGKVVAIKKSNIIDKSQIEQFINEVVVLSQINHRNVVKLLGCCLETEVPLLVYEFVNNGTLFEFIHNGRNANNSTWKTRLRIAAEAAGALSYLHSAASIPIIHRDVKSANILIDETYTAKVSDFGASRLVPMDQTALATMVQGTFGYLDPEYMQTSELTEKSDVYSFGVVIVELLTGKTPLSKEKKSLAIHFLSCLREGRLFEFLQDGISNDENKEEIEEVATLAAKCLRLKGEERPSMKEVAKKLEGIMLMQKQKQNQPSTSSGQTIEDTQYLLTKSSFKYEHDDCSSHQNIEYESIRGQVLIDLDDGR